MTEAFLSNLDNLLSEFYSVSSDNSRKAQIGKNINNFMYITSSLLLLIIVELIKFLLSPTPASNETGIFRTESTELKEFGELLGMLHSAAAAISIAVLTVVGSLYFRG